MRRLKPLLLLVTFHLLFTPRAQAQVCLGLPSFGAASIHVNFAGEFPDSATAYAVGVGGGRDNQVFGNLGAGQITYEGLAEKSTFGFIEFGYQLPVSRVQICPIVSGYIGRGPDDDDAGLRVRARGVTGGIAVGTPIATRWLSFIPNVSARYSFDEQEVEEEDIGSITERFDGGLFDLGLGLVFGDRFSIQPILHIPFGSEDDDMSFGIFAAVRFNWRDW